ncbi:DUF6616 family protein [Brucellaceae bacterium C25G]
MPHYLAELYSPKQAWLDLSFDERQVFLNKVGSAMPALTGLGIEAIALGKIDQSQLNADSHHFYAIWRCADDQTLNALINGITQSGWHDYFETINAGGAGGDFANHLVQLVNLD